MSVPARSYGRRTSFGKAFFFHGYSAVPVEDHFALLVDGEHCALGEPVIRAAIQYHHLVWPDLLGTIRDAR